MLLQIHDELIFEVRAARRRRRRAALVREMEHAIELSVPLEVTLKTRTQLVRSRAAGRRGGSNVFDHAGIAVALPRSAQPVAGVVHAPQGRR